MIRLTLLLLFSFTLSTAQVYYDTELEFTDGSVERVLVTINRASHELITYKSVNSSSTISTPYSNLKRITYYVDSDTTVYERHPYYYGRRVKKIDSTGSWFSLVQSGYVTVYRYRSILSVGHSMTSGGSSVGAPAAVFSDYYVVRPGEAALSLVSTVASINDHYVIRKSGAAYFSDYPELAAKIISKQYKSGDILKIVDEYNNWIADKAN